MTTIVLELWLQLVWNKHMTIRLESSNVTSGELPLKYWGGMKADYEAQNRDYAGVYKGKQEDCDDLDKNKRFRKLDLLQHQDGGWRISTSYEPKKFENAVSEAYVPGSILPPSIL
jgi:hypothetical protein